MLLHPSRTSAKLPARHSERDQGSCSTDTHVAWVLVGAGGLSPVRPLPEPQGSQPGGRSLAQKCPGQAGRNALEGTCLAFWEL